MYIPFPLPLPHAMLYDHALLILVQGYETIVKVLA